MQSCQKVRKNFMIILQKQLNRKERGEHYA